MPLSSELEERLCNELRRKIEIVRNSPGHPSEKTVQDRIQWLGDQCYEWLPTIRQARYEYVNLMHDRDYLLNQRGGALHFYVKLRQLHEEHQQQRRDLLTTAELFALAHEWYEILVAAGEANELDRLAFLHSLNEKVHLEPTEPGDQNYPQPTQVHRTYQLREVLDMVKAQKRNFGHLLDEEREEVIEARKRSKISCAIEEEATRDMRIQLEQLHNIVQTKAAELHERIDALERAYSVSFTRLMESINEKHAVILSKLDMLPGPVLRPESPSRMDVDESHRSGSPINGEPLENEEEYRNPSPYPESNTSEEDDAERVLILQRRINDGEREFREIEEYLANNWVRERHFGSRTMKWSEAKMMCVYCKEQGQHYSDACPNVPSVAERTDILEAEGRCKICVERHDTDSCTRSNTCFYCKKFRRDPKEREKHHASICPRPEDFARTIERRHQLRKELDDCYRRLDEIMAPGPSRN